VAVAGPVEDVAKPLAEGQSGPQGILHEGHELVGRDADRVVGREVLDEAIAHRLGVVLGDEGAEEAVPDDEHAGVVGIEVARVPTVVDPVVAGGVHHPLDGGREAADGLGVDPVLVDEVDPANEGQHDGVDAQEHHQRGP